MPFRAYQDIVPAASLPRYRRVTSILSQPYAGRVLGAATQFFLPVWIPPDVRQVRVKVALRDSLGIAGNGSDVTAQKIAVGTPNDALTDFVSGQVEVESGITYPAIGQYGYGSWQDVRANAAGYIGIGYTVPAGSYYSETSQYYGYEKAGTDPSSFSGAVASSNPAGAVGVEYDTDAVKVVFLGDSRCRGIAGSGEAGFLNGYHRLGPQLGWAVMCNSVASTTAASWDARTNWFLADNWIQVCRDATVFIAHGYNDIAAGTTAVPIIGYFTDLIRDAYAVGAKRVIPCTIGPSSALTGPNNTERGYVNTWIRSLRNDYFDVDAIVRNPGLPNQLLYPATGNVHWLTQSYTDLIAAMVTGTYLPGGLPY